MRACSTGVFGSCLRPCAPMSRSPPAAAETNIRVRTLESEHKSRMQKNSRSAQIHGRDGLYRHSRFRVRKQKSIHFSGLLDSGSPWSLSLGRPKAGPVGYGRNDEVGASLAFFLQPVTPIRPDSPSGLNSVVATDTTAHRS